MEILLWLVPAAVVTTMAMLWAAWAGRETTRTIDPDEAAARLGRALRSDRPVRYSARPAPATYDNGSVAVRPVAPAVPAAPADPEPVVRPVPLEATEERRPSESPVHTAAPAEVSSPERTRRAS